ncbi:MAG: NAD(P)H-dependent oxidoreductase subunit E, partial [Dehalococcoidales bacterium]
MIKLINTEDLATNRKVFLQNRQAKNQTIIICGGTGCKASRSQEVIDAINQELLTQEMDSMVHLRVTGCHGFCEQGPIMIIEPGNTFYCQVTADDVYEIVTRTLRDGEIIDRLLYTDPVSGSKIRTESEIPFYKAQERHLLSQNREINPLSIEDYIATGGYKALSHTLENLSPEETIREVKISGLRGRGGGGFPTGRKWAECSDVPSDEKYVICNADEGDPGAYMDRCLLEGNPFLVLEGMTIGAFAVGATKGYVYVRNEYPL